ncbi:PorT family protein [Spirosoma sp. BT702]|uniref:PorT family protein n=1 Tax=Spirosoma profusum TaxID=2771354 RepID=A0A927AN28_9BACT|nr:outer membrane beta-barrel protein [Spirosoma profusum]MBD2700994.1 PorT family protein [Spirosoma profusum]
MKLLFSVLVLTVCQVGVSFAQTGSPAKPAGTSTQSTNRQQELYDQYHGVTKKSSTPSTAPTNTPTTSTPATSRPTPITQSAPTASGSTSGNTSGSMSGNTSGNMPVNTSGSSSGIRIGLRGGVTYPIFLESQPGVESGIGFTGGVTFNFGAGTLSFQPEVNYTRYTAKGRISTIGTITQASDFIEVPLFLKIASGTYDGNRFFVNIGPYGAYNTSASIDGKKFSLEGASGRIRFGAAAGLGAAIQAGPGHFTVEVRGLYSLGDTDDGFDTDSKTIFAQAAVGYIFPLGGR